MSLIATGRTYLTRFDDLLNRVREAESAAQAEGNKARRVASCG